MSPPRLRDMRMSKRRDKIALLGAEFRGRHGVLPEERALGQIFVVDLELLGDFSRAASSDALEDAVDYSAVYDRMRAVVEGPPLHLLEAVADRVCAAVFPVSERIDEITVRIKKPLVPLSGFLECSMVELTRIRPGSENR